MSNIHVGNRADHFQELGKGIFPIVAAVAAVAFTPLLEMTIQQAAAAQVAIARRRCCCILKQHS